MVGESRATGVEGKGSTFGFDLPYLQVVLMMKGGMITSLYSP